MPFRADEAAERGRKWALDRLAGTSIPAIERVNSRDLVYDLIDKYGPVVDSYPFWHPLISESNRSHHWTKTLPDVGFEGLDHTIYFRDALVTCPYDGGESIMGSVVKLQKLNPACSINVEILEVKLYNEMATPILVSCEWDKPLLRDGTVSQSLAFPLLLDAHLPIWRTAKVGETWDTMHSYILGSPHGKISSLFVNKETGTALKSLWNLLLQSGMFGPIHVNK